ncbi:MAG: hypothetical protein ACYTG1_08005 [Planctomycetota bacterium]|jgi:hypothetical protein
MSRHHPRRSRRILPTGPGLLSIALPVMLLAGPADAAPATPPTPTAGAQAAPAAKPRAAMSARQAVRERGERRARMLGRLLYLPVTRRLEDVPAREAFELLAQDLGVPIVGRYLDDRSGHGIDPDLLVFIDGGGRSGLDVLADLLDQCEGLDPCAWQMRGGFIEVGTKRRLARHAETRIYHIRDMLLKPAYFAKLGGRGEFEIRKRPEQLAAEIIATIAHTVEPEAWEPALDDDPFERPSSAPGGGAGGARAAAAARDDPLKLSGRWASLSYFDGTLIVRAPDFVHRQIGGYPEPIVPDEALAVPAGPAPAAAVPDP